MKSCTTEWTKRRARVLHRACLAVEKHHAAGRRIVDAFRLAAQQYVGSKLDAQRRLQLSTKSMCGHYYRWLRRNRCPGAFEIVRHLKRWEPPAATVKALLRIAVDAGMTARDLFAFAGGSEALGCSEATLRRVLPRRLAELARLQKRVTRVRFEILRESKAETEGRAEGWRNGGGLSATGKSKVGGPKRDVESRSQCACACRTGRARETGSGAACSGRSGRSGRPQEATGGDGDRAGGAGGR